jgi:hypothetical protein
VAGPVGVVDQVAFDRTQHPAGHAAGDRGAAEAGDVDAGPGDHFPARGGHALELPAPPGGQADKAGNEQLEQRAGGQVVAAGGQGGERLTVGAPVDPGRWDHVVEPRGGGQRRLLPGPTGDDGRAPGAAAGPTRRRARRTGRKKRACLSLQTV